MKFTRSRFAIILFVSVFTIAGALALRTRTSQSKYNDYAAPQAAYEVLLTPSPFMANCAPLPGAGEEQPERTATPQHGQGHKVPVSPTATQYPSIQLIDLNPELPEAQKAVILVFRCSGAYDKYLAGPDQEIPAALNMQEGDVILEAIPPAEIVGAEPQQEPTNPPEHPDPYPVPNPYPYPYP